jgi:hypothetical protein
MTLLPTLLCWKEIGSGRQIIDTREKAVEVRHHLIGIGGCAVRQLVGERIAILRRCHAARKQ